MPEFLQAPMTAGLHLSTGELLLRLVIALGFGVVVAGIYALTQRHSRTELAPMATTLVLLTILIAMVTLVIGNSTARAFALAGALAIIRFRTVVEDTRDTAFVIFAVVVGMAIGADDMLPIALLGAPVVAAAAFALSFFGRTNPSAGAGVYSLSVRLGLGRDPARLQELFTKHLSDVRLKATTTARQGSALELSYDVRLRRAEDAVAFVTELNQVEGVQNVELRQL